MLCIRIDDVSYDMNYEKFERIISILNKHNIKALLGVIPDNLDPDLKKHGQMDKTVFSEKLALLKDKHLFAMHGTHHTFHYKKIGNPYIKLNNYSEFSGLSYDEQFSLLQEGVSKLKEMNIETNIFMAPAHTFDENTIMAAKELGFRYFTDGYGGRVLEDKNGMIFLPCSISKYKKIKRINTICLHPNIMSDSEISNLEKALENHRDEFFNYDELLRLKPTGRICLVSQHLIVFYRKIKSFGYKIYKKIKK